MAHNLSNGKGFYSYSNLYKEECFLTWWEAGRPTQAGKIKELIPKDTDGRQADLETFRKWRAENGWDVRGDYLDAQAVKEAEDSIVQSKILMLKEHAARARMVGQQAADFLEENGFDSSASAVQALFKAAELERTSRGMSANLLKILELDDDGLVSETQKLLERAMQAGQTIDVAEAVDVEEDASESD